MSEFADEVLSQSSYIFAENPPFLKTGHVINDRFEITGRLGSGTQANVYEAVDSETKLDVALKVPLIPDEEALNRFVREAEITRALSEVTPHVPNFVDADLVRGYSRLFMYTASEKMPGGTLADLLKDTKGPLDIDKTKEVTETAFEGLMQAHESGIVHADVKPANILLTLEHGVERGKLGDFGIARIEDDASSFLSEHEVSTLVMDTISHGGPARCTPICAAPELVLDSESIGKEADVFAAGALLTICLARKFPIKGSETVGSSPAGLRIVMQNYEPPTQDIFDNTQVPKSLARVIIATLDPNPINRPTLDEVITELH